MWSVSSNTARRRYFSGGRVCKSITVRWRRIPLVAANRSLMQLGLSATMHRSRTCRFGQRLDFRKLSIYCFVLIVWHGTMIDLYNEPPPLATWAPGVSFGNPPPLSLSRQSLSYSFQSVIFPSGGRLAFIDIESCVSAVAYYSWCP